MAKSIGKNAKKEQIINVATYKSIHIIYVNKLVKGRTRNGSAFLGSRLTLSAIHLDS